MQGHFSQADHVCDGGTGKFLLHSDVVSNMASQGSPYPADSHAAVA
jgi:hypothetical protein